MEVIVEALAVGLSNKDPNHPYQCLKERSANTARDKDSVQPLIVKDIQKTLEEIVEI